MQEYVRTLQQWRKNKEVIHYGKLMHFVPENGMYAYFRYNDKETVMVVLNKNDKDTRLPTGRFVEIMGDYTSGRDVVSAEQLNDLTEITVPAKSAMIIELR